MRRDQTWWIRARNVASRSEAHCFDSSIPRQPKIRGRCMELNRRGKRRGTTWPPSESSNDKCGTAARLDGGWFSWEFVLAIFICVNWARSSSECLNPYPPPPLSHHPTWSIFQNLHGFSYFDPLPPSCTPWARKRYTWTTPMTTS